MPDDDVGNGLDPESQVGSSPPNSGGTENATNAATSSNSSSNKRRRTSGAPSSRGVANLTPEQLARKRANDREAQRAIRERTKNQIETLQARIRELENQQPYHERQVALRQKEAVERENEDIRRRLASIWAIVQPILASRGGSLEELAAAASRSPLLPHPSDPSDATHLQLPPADLTPVSAPAHTPLGDNTQRHWFTGVSGANNSRNEAQDPSGEGWQNAIYSQGSRSSGTEMTSNIQPDLQTYGADERLGVSFLLDDPRQSMKLGQTISNHSASPTLSQHQASRRVLDPSAPHAATPKNGPATCPLDNILLDAVTERTALLEAGRPAEEVLGPEYPNFTILMNTDARNQSHPISQLFTDILRTFPDISGLPEQVAIFYMMFLFFRWHIHPTLANFRRMPEWLAPRVAQILKEHPCWSDYIPFPRLREIIAQLSSPVPFDTFFIPYTTTIKVNWLYEPKDCLIEIESVGEGSHGGKQWIINPAFETHLRNLENWTLGKEFKDELPELAEGVKIA